MSIFCAFQEVGSIIGKKGEIVKKFREEVRNGPLFSSSIYCSLLTFGLDVSVVEWRAIMIRHTLGACVAAEDKEVCVCMCVCVQKSYVRYSCGGQGKVLLCSGV